MDEYFELLRELRELDVIRSYNVLGDIGEYLCTVVFENLKLVDEITNQDFDATDGQSKIQIKFSNSSDGKNIDLGKPGKYDELIVVLGANSVHRHTEDKDGEYVFYRYTSAQVQSHFGVNSGYKLSKTKHFKRADAIYPSLINA
ncbi:hypothetical protein SAMN02745127_01525 [Oceanospirillum multiglobuliferum]|uniref:Uncharacterized protein n=1 Tax=Oceanospirillum multiglobuliferum TaxID=64969 RepID=A0A1T4PMW3_9GAMM|nr:hypothetical protein [Oceanospirillum multiglobuliferum]OPX54099.1 hypothetical protein BTE48_16010 [Oceanospirillum multiglobuliferum]SJZ92596.1 hypothetical protein SAMN02745127_01525 [Oceanospirillum multiglobuliferum]